METVKLSVSDYIRKINHAEAMLEEIKRGLMCSDREFQDSIKRGEKGIKAGRVTVCKTKKDLEPFFSSI